MLRYYSQFRLDPKTMTDDEFFEAWEQLSYALEQTGQMSK